MSANTARSGRAKIALPVRQHDGVAALDLLDELDTPWITALIDEVEAAIGRPWGELLERLARLPSRTKSGRQAAAIAALRGLLSGRARGGPQPATVRERLLGRPALEPEDRRRRLMTVAAALTTSVDELEQAMWADLPAERAVTMPRDRPTAVAVAGAANLALVQRALLRCHELRLALTGNARAIARAAAVRGLMSTAHSQGTRIELQISGPLALFHRTTIYGRVLGSLVPHLAWCERFVLDARCDLGRGEVTLRIQPPILLPPGPAPKPYDSALEARFARDMRRHAPGWRVVREPSPVDAGGRLAFPDFLLIHRDDDERRWWLEIVGFWTQEYLEHKLATYRAARLQRVILCIDAARDVEPHALPTAARVVRFDRAVPIDQVLAIIERSG